MTLYMNMNVLHANSLIFSSIPPIPTFFGACTSHRRYWPSLVPFAPTPSESTAPRLKKNPMLSMPGIIFFKNDDFPTKRGRYALRNIRIRASLWDERFAMEQSLSIVTTRFSSEINEIARVVPCDRYRPSSITYFSYDYTCSYGYSYSVTKVTPNSM